MFTYALSLNGDCLEQLEEAFIARSRNCEKEKNLKKNLYHFLLLNRTTSLEVKQSFSQKMFDVLIKIKFQITQSLSKRFVTLLDFYHHILT